MEELKILVGLIADLPQTALYILAGFFIYKVVVVGSIYGVIKLAIVKAHLWLTTPKESNVIYKLNDITIVSGITGLLIQIGRIAGIKSHGSKYIHDSDIEWLKDAINEKIQRDKND